MLFYFPDAIQILTRRFYYNHPAREGRKYITEEIAFQNNGNKEVNEIILQIDKFRDNLRILDKNNTNMIYLPKYEIIRRGKDYIGQDLLNDVNDNKIYLLWIILNEPLLPHMQQIMYMRYIEQPIIEYNWYTFGNEYIKNRITFYDNETITVNSSWEDGLSIENSPVFAVTKDLNILFFHHINWINPRENTL